MCVIWVSAWVECERKAGAAGEVGMVDEADQGGNDGNGGMGVGFYDWRN